MCIKQVATPLGYDEPQILEAFKKHPSYRIILGIIPHRRFKTNSRNEKRILTKEKIERQLVGQSSATPFMNIKYSYNKKVTFKTQDGLEEKIDRLRVMMSKLTSKDDGLNKQFKPKIFQSKRREQMRNFYDKCYYDQSYYQNRYRLDSGDRRISFSSRIQYGQNYRDRPRYEKNYRNNFRQGSFRGNVRMYQNQNNRRQNYIGEYRGNYRNENYNRGRSSSRERQHQGNMRRNDRSNGSRSRSGSGANTNRERIRCYKCREYDHFTTDCPTTKVEKEIDQLQQIFNLDEEQTSLKHWQQVHMIV